MRHYIHDTWQVCGLVYIDLIPPSLPHRLRQIGVEAQATILATTQRTSLKQTFVTPPHWHSVGAANPVPRPPSSDFILHGGDPSASAPQLPQRSPEVRYQFPLHDGVSVVSFTATIHDKSLSQPRVIKGVVQEKEEARQTYHDAVQEGKAAGLLELIPEAADVFVTKLGNIPPATKVIVEVQYLGELKHDAGVDGLRLTIPMGIAPRFGQWPGDLVEAYTPVLSPPGLSRAGGENDEDLEGHGLKITVDAHLPPTAQIQSVSSSSHQIAVSIGKTSKSDANQTLAFNQASATLALNGTAAAAAHLDKDFILHLSATSLSTPQAVLEQHPTIPEQHALMATFVPKFALPSSPASKQKPEVIFLCDRSGSMTSQIPNLISALRIFIKSLPQGVRFNIASFGSRFSFLWPQENDGTSGSRGYARDSVTEAMKHVDSFTANYGGTEMYRPFEIIFEQWNKQHGSALAALGEGENQENRDLEVFLLTDGEIWEQDRLLQLVERNVQGSKGRIRVFSLGIGSGASSALVEGVARVGNGFAQSVADGEDMSGKVVRMVKGAMFEHIRKYNLEVKYGAADDDAMSQTDAGDSDDGFEVVEKVRDVIFPDEQSKAAPPAYTPTTSEQANEKAPANPPTKLSLFDESVTMDTDLPNHDDLPRSFAGYADLPPCPPPSILQTPYEIPPLFPFNRTTVYLLFSKPFPTNKHGQVLLPKSIVLRGTTVSGVPLELDIPVSVLPEPGETIHQLATRRAVQELEEGKGWIYHAKYPKGANETKDGNDQGLLRTWTAKPHFQAMVQREAVRLGVTFQVGGGKWCSFVAVEEMTPNDKDKSNKTSETYIPIRSVDPKATSGSQPRVCGYPVARATRARRDLSRAAPAARDGAAPPPQQSQQSQALFSGAPAGFAPVPTTFSNGPRRLKAFIRRLGSSASTNTPAEEVAQQQTAPPGRQGIPFAPPAAMITPMGVPSPVVDQASIASCKRHGPTNRLSTGARTLQPQLATEACRKSAPTEYMVEDDEEEEGQQLLPESPATSREKFDALVGLQGFDGSWAWTDVLKVLGWSDDKIAAAWNEDNIQGKMKEIPNMEDSERDLFATAIVVAWLRTEMVELKDSWELLVDKAVERLGEDDAKSLWAGDSGPGEEKLGQFLEDLEKLVKKLIGK